MDELVDVGAEMAPRPELGALLEEEERGARGLAHERFVEHLLGQTVVRHQVDPDKVDISERLRKSVGDGRHDTRCHLLRAVEEGDESPVRPRRGVERLLPLAHHRHALHVRALGPSAAARVVLQQPTDPFLRAQQLQHRRQHRSGRSATHTELRSELLVLQEQLRQLACEIGISGARAADVPELERELERQAVLCRHGRRLLNLLPLPLEQLHVMFAHRSRWKSC
mmetsp:Transcript_39835/g.87443  ORF Transcript_39835/g.87443 Transcript_39835/m.87443 type:complete len:225 (+) Transcript_39835:381-1055(+)